MKFTLSLQHLLVTPKVQEAWDPCRGRQGDPGPSLDQKSFETGRATSFLNLTGLRPQTSSEMVNNICCCCCTRLHDLFEQQRTGKMTSRTRGGKMAPWR